MNTLTALATGLLVLVGLAQVVVLVAQKRQTKLELINLYQRRWLENKKNWGKVIFVGRTPKEYYQVVDEQSINDLEIEIQATRYDTPTIWARDSIQSITSLLSEICLRILQGQLNVADVYPIFGSELLRHSRPLRVLLDTDNRITTFQENMNEKHTRVQTEMQDWLIYHDGLRRRCLMLIDFLWAEAVRLEDLPPGDIRSAADSKKRTGNLNRNRVFKESLRLNGVHRLVFSWRLSQFIRHSEYYRFWSRKGISKNRLLKLESTWTKRVLRKR